MKKHPCKTCLVFPMCNSVASNIMTYKKYINMPYAVMRALTEECEILHKYIYEIEFTQEFYSANNSNVYLIYNQHRFEETTKLYKLITENNSIGQFA